MHLTLITYALLHLNHAGSNKVSFVFSEKSIEVSEDSGTIADQLFIEISGQIEPTVSVSITMKSSKSDSICNYYSLMLLYTR